jgi:hypothetical protein
MKFLDDQDNFPFDLEDQYGFQDVAGASHAAQEFSAQAPLDDLQDFKDSQTHGQPDPDSTVPFVFDLGPPLEFDPPLWTEPLEPLEDSLLPNPLQSSELNQGFDFLSEPDWTAFPGPDCLDTRLQGTLDGADLQSHTAPTNGHASAAYQFDENPLHSFGTPFVGSYPACLKSPNKSPQPSSPTECGPVRKKPKACRTLIPPHAKILLESHFSLNAYPSANEVSMIASKTSLAETTVRTWFANARQRKENPNSKSLASTQPINSFRLHFVDPPPKPISVKNLKELDRISPPPVNVSLDRYLTSSRTDEPVATRVLQSRPANKFATQPINISPLKRSDSDVGSVGSARSIASGGSFRSIDSRGSRQGRTSWRKPMMSNVALETAVPDVSQPNNTGRWFCTWSDCDKTFEHRFEWKRHEEAVHYCPYHWVCCSERNRGFDLHDCWFCDAKSITLQHIADEHFTTCTDKATQKRTFLREDLFVAHFKRHRMEAGGHVVGSTYRNLAELWKEDNLATDHCALHCGICGNRFSTWAERCFDVSMHIKSGVSKSAWWSQRLSAPLDWIAG